MYFSTISAFILFAMVFLVCNAKVQSFVDDWICHPIILAIEEALQGDCTCKGAFSLHAFSFNLDASCTIPVDFHMGTVTAAITGHKADVGMAVTMLVVNGNSYGLAFSMTYECKLLTWTPTGCQVKLGGSTCTLCTVNDGGFPWPGCYACNCSNAGYNGDCSDFQP